MLSTGFGNFIADRMDAEHRVLAARWFDRLLDLLPVDARDVFPSESLLDHIPSLISEIAGYVRRPEDAIAANSAILDKARELGALRHGQRASLHQILREYQILGELLVAFVSEEMERCPSAPSSSESVPVVARLHQSVNVITQATVETFVQLYTQTIQAQRERLEQFTRMAAHEWRQPLGTLQFGVSLLRESPPDSPRARRALDVLERNVRNLVDVTHKLESVARMHTAGESPVTQEVSITTVAQEAARQLRDMAEAHGVSIDVDDDLPSAVIDVGRLELIFVNLFSNAIKYSDPAKDLRFVKVGRSATAAGEPQPAEGRCLVRVEDNGLGISAASLPSVFERFTRAHTDQGDGPHISGIGLGLSIVYDCVVGIGGDVSVTSAEGEGTTFLLALPTTPGRVPPPTAKV